MQSSPGHPASRPLVPMLMLLLLVLGVVFVSMDDLSTNFSLIDLASVLSIACFVVLFGVHWLAWLLREHELWRERRHQAATARVTS
jgi:amino acid permease